MSCKWKKEQLRAKVLAGVFERVMDGKRGLSCNVDAINVKIAVGKLHLFLFNVLKNRRALIKHLCVM